MLYAWPGLYTGDVWSVDTARTQQQLMGQLPSARTTPAPPFTTCGVDYAGPFLLKKGHTRKPVMVKCYMSVFICFSTKAVHLEPVSDATTRTFVECLKRFISRRGCPQHIYSDNGGNFVGARGEIKEFFRMLNKEETISFVTSYLLNHRVQWHASPEQTPHFGGLWEAAVKSAKLNLKKSHRSSASNIRGVSYGTLPGRGLPSQQKILSKILTSYTRSYKIHKILYDDKIRSKILNKNF